MASGRGDYGGKGDLSQKSWTINVPHFEEDKMTIDITSPYLWLPVANGKMPMKLNFFVDGEKMQEVDIALGGKSCNFYSAMDVRKYLGRKMEIEGVVAPEAQGLIACHDTEPPHDYPYQPKVHFATRVGWINDPNGLFLVNGVYHIYHQWNPYSTDWGNMHWGYATSRDLLHWDIKGMAMETDKYGPIFSGCAYIDKENAAGYGKDTVLYIYTAAGGNNQWSGEEGNLG